MVQHDKSAADLDRAINNIRKAGNQYMNAVNEALIQAGYTAESRRCILNKITEHEPMIIKMCRDRKRNIR